MKKAAAERIEAATVEVETSLLIGGLESDEARRCVEGMPTVEELMPPLDGLALRQEIEAAPRAKMDHFERRMLRMNRRWELEEQGIESDAELIEDEEAE